MLKGKKIGAIAATVAIMASIVSAPAMAYTHFSLSSKGVETGYYGSSLHNRAYAKIKNGDFDFYYEIAMRDRKGKNIGWKKTTCRNQHNQTVKVTSCWNDRSYGTNGTMHIAAWEL